VVSIQLDCRDPHRHLVGVRLTVSPQRRSLRLQLPCWTPGSYLIRDYVRHLEGLVATQGESPLALRRLTPSSWQLPCDPDAGPVTLTYRVMATELSVRTCHIDHQHAFLALAAVVLEVEGERWSPHRLTLLLPEGWTGFVPLPADPGGGWLATSFDQLVDSPVEAGPHRALSFDVAGVPHRWITWGACAGGEGWLMQRFPSLLDDVQRVCLRGCQLVGGELINLPGGGFGQTLRTPNTAKKSDEEQYIPTSLRSQFALRIPDELRPYLGLPENSNATTYLTDVDVPGTDILNLIKTSGGVPSLQDTTMELFGQMNPLLKSAAELATNTDFYTRRPLNQSVTRADRIYRAITGREDTLNPFLKAAINNAPLPLRAVNTIGGLLDERVPLQQRLVREGANAFSGVKLRDVDPEWQLQDARRKIASQLQGHTKDYVESFIPEGLLPYVSPHELDLYNLDKELRRDLRQMKDAKRKAGEL